MIVNERIRVFRNLRGVTQKQLGVAVGFSEKTADIRIAQYESGKRSPKEETVKDIAKALDISPEALDVPNMDSQIGLMHTLFAVEDMYGLEIDRIEGQLCLRFKKGTDAKHLSLIKRLITWEKEAKKLKKGETTKEEYDNWRYTYK